MAVMIAGISVFAVEHARRLTIFRGLAWPPIQVGVVEVSCCGAGFGLALYGLRVGNSNTKCWEFDPFMVGLRRPILDKARRARHRAPYGVRRAQHCAPFVASAQHCDCEDVAFFAWLGNTYILFHSSHLLVRPLARSPRPSRSCVVPCFAPPRLA